MQEDEPERGNASGHQRVKLQGCTVCEGHEFEHQIPAKLWRRGDIGDPRRSSKGVGQMVLFMPEGHRPFKRLGNRIVLQRDQVVFGKRLAVMCLAQQLNKTL